MAADNGKKKGKKGKPEPRNWSKIAVQAFIVLMMLMAVVAFTLNYNGSNSNQNSDKSSISFNGISDALRLIPANASYARYADLKNDTLLANSTMKYFWLYGTLPASKVFGADPRRDLFAIYPANYFGDFPEQFVSLTDFGTAKINTSYPDYTKVQGVKRVNKNYYYTYETKPVVSGRIENVLPTANVMLSGGANAYGNYSGIFDEMRLKHVPTAGMTLEMVGRSCNLSYVDGYYAAVGPVDRGNKSSDRLYNYTVVMRLNQTMPEADLQNLALLERAMEKMGFVSYRTQFYEDYIIIEAQGPLDVCMEDMQLRWDFIKYQASL